MSENVSEFGNKFGVQDNMKDMYAPQLFSVKKKQVQTDKPKQEIDHNNEIPAEEVDFAHKYIKNANNICVFKN